jgi:hypothetical protein
VKAATGYGCITADEADAMLDGAPLAEGRQEAERLVPC